MKEKEPEPYLEKDRKHLDRSKRRRGDEVEETLPAKHRPKLEPYHKPKQKNWIKQTYEEQD